MCITIIYVIMNNSYIMNILMDIWNLMNKINIKKISIKRAILERKKKQTRCYGLICQTRTPDYRLNGDQYVFFLKFIFNLKKLKNSKERLDSRAHMLG
jgi:hypothetical protein